MGSFSDFLKEEGTYEETSEQAVKRVPGRKDRPFGLRPPTKEEMEWVESWAERYVSKVPKGLFRYNSHEEANADWDKWMALGRWKNPVEVQFNEEPTDDDCDMGQEGRYGVV